MDMVISVDQLPSIGETRIGSRLAYYPGGKGANQAVAAARAAKTHEGSVHFFGCVGKDEFGDRLIQILESENIETSGIERVSSPTGCASIWVNQGGENSILIAPGANQEVQATRVPSHLLTEETVLVLQMEIPHEQNWLLIKRAARLGVRVILNCAPADSIPKGILSLLEGLILNEGEARILARHLGMEATSLSQWGKEIAKKYNLWIAITRGKMGALLCTPDEIWEASALLIRPQDTTAAGDAFVGVFASFLSFGYTLSACLHHAVVAGGLACLESGAIPSIPRRASILGARKDLPLPSKVA